MSAALTDIDTSSEDAEVLPSNANDGEAAAPRERTAKGYVLTWCQKVYFVPAEAVISLPKCPALVEDGNALGSILASKSPEVWRDACNVKHLMMLKGREGKSVYCTFAVKENPSEERFIRLVTPGVCDKLFPKLLEELEADPANARPQTERARLRKEVLKWRSSDINGHVQLNPLYNEWERCTEPDLKSCLRLPVPRPIKKLKTSGDEGGAQLPPGIKSLHRVDVCEEAGFHVMQRPGAVFVFQFEKPPVDVAEA